MKDNEKKDNSQRNRKGIGIETELLESQQQRGTFCCGGKYGQAGGQKEIIGNEDRSGGNAT